MDCEFISASALLIFLLKKVLLNRMITSWSSQKQVVMQIQQFSNTFSLCICAYACACVSCWCVCVCVFILLTSAVMSWTYLNVRISNLILWKWYQMLLAISLISICESIIFYLQRRNSRSACFGNKMI